MKVYVVMRGFEMSGCGCGNEHIAAAFADEDDAKDHVAELKKKFTSNKRYADYEEVEIRPSSKSPEKT